MLGVVTMVRFMRHGLLLLIWLTAGFSENNINTNHWFGFLEIELNNVWVIGQTTNYSSDSSEKQWI